MSVRITVARAAVSAIALVAGPSRDLAAQGGLDSVALYLASPVVPITIGVNAEARTVGSVHRQLTVHEGRSGVRPRTLSELLQARLPGVSVLRYGGLPTDGSRVRIRGTNSLRGTAAPLLVVDGVPVNSPERLGATLIGSQGSRFDDFDPEEIERVDVLSGPAATTLFGSGASNGVIALTTKRGTSGPLRLHAWTQGLVGTDPTDFPANYRRNGTSTAPGGGCDVVAIANGQCTNPTTLDVFNPLEEVSPFRNGRSGVAGLSATGGPFGIRSYGSVVARSETGVLGDTRSSRANGRLNLEREVVSGLTLGGNVGYLRRWGTMRTDQIVERGLLGSAVDDVDRGYLPDFGSSLGDREGDRLTRSARLDWQVLTWLRLHVTGGRDEMKQDDHIVFVSFPSGEPTTPADYSFVQTSSIGIGAAEARHTLGPVQLTSLLTYEDTHRFEFEQESRLGFLSWLTRRGSLRAWMAQERVAFRDRFFLNAGIRRIDRERSDDSPGWHPSVDGVWEIGRIPGVPGLNALRLRGAYAIGIQSRDTTSSFFLVPPPFPGTPVPVVGPEKPRELELGADFSLGDRVRIEATMFEQYTPRTRMVIGIGFPFVVEPKLRNRGLELLGRFELVDRAALTWTATLAAGTLRNRVAFSEGFGDFIYLGAAIRNEQPVGTFITRDVTFTDANGDNLPAFTELQLGDLRPGGTAVPTREVSLRTTVTLPASRISLSALVDHRGGHRAINVFDHAQCGRFVRNCRAMQDPSVPQQEKINAAIESAVANRQYIEDASYTRLGGVAIHWRTGLGTISSRDALTISLEGRNLVTWSRFRGPDVEVATATALRGGLPVVPAVPSIPRSIALTIDFDVF